MTAAPESICRSYQRPTCTLAIEGQLSPLSQWSRRPLLKQVHFQLQLCQGDQAFQLQGDHQQLSQLTHLVQDYVQQRLGHHDTPIPPVSSPQPDGLTLSPAGGTRHYLSLGPLAQHHTPQGLTLSTLQLFDLTTVLDQAALAANIVEPSTAAQRPLQPLALPLRNVPRRHRHPWLWASSAAGLLLAVGIGALISQTSQSPPQTATSSLDTAEDATTEALRAPSASESPAPAADPSVTSSSLPPTPAEAPTSSGTQPPAPAAEAPPSPDATAAADSPPETASPGDAHGSGATHDADDDITAAVPPEVASSQRVEASSNPQHAWLQAISQRLTPLAATLSPATATYRLTVAADGTVAAVTTLDQDLDDQSDPEDEAVTSALVGQPLPPPPSQAEQELWLRFHPDGTISLSLEPF
ncbi:hypothetical protein XM38_052170 [Halomicronema hongdechloris C2206]|uniref:DUF4335 domain-containing protein n=2 Tax=Halomicronema hongdechloris TaxID=1209493 RepID=A0A1Z3HVE4_9CYAN|nr:hypothetical protein XM38_052170 [Halomicronema hongdechloris C2206]